ncbi:3-phosphoshikimate 1-carboxyvinyltransferase [Fusobacterium sp. FSA-380-WT-3A]|uniref:3-phosphoshikimate 1-carboxyvinyltransferase n=1 Tax=Fusobacterium sp. FSA-380-WT-3A TaxID=2725304 RepID=UPI001476C3D6|nr:3-phosphoshikimate 1-carboxyvinyltransferase [Fusobacterium sp. FSA-380-WT-3A]NME34978.1 3-phosphoshikimate 1-carboxyvinyltransferase [Fusobacterium sp. FSA-380-WT-3A]
MKEEYSIKTRENFHTEISIPGSKSMTTRALILASLSENPVILKNPLFSEDIVQMIECLTKLGNKILVSDDKKYIKISGNKKREFGKKTLHVGNSGSVMKFLISYIATGRGEITIDASSRVTSRPIREFVDSMRELGIEIEYLKKSGFLPIKIYSQGTKSNIIKVPGKNSSQYLSSVLLSASHFNSDIEVLTSHKISSKSYIDITLKMLHDFGAKIEKTENGYLVKKTNFDTVKGYLIEGDMASASYFLAAALITNSTIKINNFSYNSIQGDYKFLEIMESLGLKIIERTKTSITVQGVESYEGFSLDLNRTPDLVPTLSIVALFANSPSEIHNVANLRTKGNDRLNSIRTELKKIYGSVTDLPDGIKIIPKKAGTYKGGVMETYNDHRLAMSFSLIGLKVNETSIVNSHCVSKVFPNFFEEFENIYK